jgi:hypothetical protein
MKIAIITLLVSSAAAFVCPIATTVRESVSLKSTSHSSFVDETSSNHRRQLVQGVIGAAVLGSFGSVTPASAASISRGTSPVHF